MTVPEETAEPSSRRQWLALAAVTFGVFVTTLDNTVVNVALPAVQRDLQLGLGGVAWVVNAYILSFAVLLLAGGRLADSYGRRRTFVAGLGVFTVASLGAGLATGAGSLIAARAAQGVGAALLTPPTLAIISHTFRDERRRATAVGIWGGAAALAFAVGPVLGGLLTQHVNWSWVFFVNVPVGALGILAARRFVPESRDPGAPQGLDVPGLVLATGSLLALTYALIRGNELGWRSPAIGTLLVLAVFGAAAFLLRERRAAAPLVDLALFRVPAFSSANGVALVINLATFGVFLFTSLFLQQILGLTPVRAGAALLPWVAMLILLAPLSGSLTRRVAPRTVVSSGLVVMATGLLLLSRIDETSSYLDLLPGLLVGGLGAALTIPLNEAAISAVPVERSGLASGVFNTARETGGSLGIAVTGAVLAHGQRQALAFGASPTHAFASGYADGLTLAAALLLAAAVVTVLGLRPRAGTADEDDQAPAHDVLPDLAA